MPDPGGGLINRRITETDLLQPLDLRFNEHSDITTVSGEGEFTEPGEDALPQRDSPTASPSRTQTGKAAKGGPYQEQGSLSDS